MFGRFHLLVTRPAVATLTRPFFTTTACQFPLDEFRDMVPRSKRMEEPVGRSWSTKELSRKSFDDLHKLWLVLYKERNMLLTEQQLGRRRGLIFPQPLRLRKVQKSLGAIRHVMGDRKQDKIAAAALKQLEDHKE
jgi:large subunit ribosomal protein L47